MKYSLNQDAKATGKSPSAIHNAIKKGKVSATKREGDSWEIDPAELHRVYPPVSDAKGDRKAKIEKPNSIENALYIRELELKLEAALQQADDLREDRDHWRRQATALLTDNRPQEHPGFWSRLFGK
jgi:hypothetical protein